jgi:WD40 repeat protein
VFGVAFSPDGKVLASGGGGGAGKSEGVIKIYDVANMKETKQLKGHTEAVTGLAFKSNTEVISISQDKTVRIWNVTDGKEIKKFDETKDDPYGLCLSKDGKTLATSGYGGWLNVWDLDPSKKDTKPIFSKKLPIFGAYCVVFSPDGKSLITGHEKVKESVKILTTPIGK